MLINSRFHRAGAPVRPRCNKPYGGVLMTTTTLVIAGAILLGILAIVLTIVFGNKKPHEHQ